MNKKTVFISLVLALVFVFTTVNADTQGITDIDKSSSYAREAILALAEKSIVTGDNQGNFEPTKPISRAEFVALLARVLNLDTENVPAEATFKDVPTNHWAFKYVEAAYKAGIVNGVSATEFGAKKISTREQMAAMFVRALNLVDSSEQIQLQCITGLTDKDSISSWAQREVDIAMTAGLMNGTSKTTFSPKKNATKEQTAVVIDRLMKSENEIADKVNVAYGLNKEPKYPNLYNALKAGINEKYIGDVQMNMDIQMTDLGTKDFMNTSSKVESTINNDTTKMHNKMKLETNGSEPMEVETQMIVTADKVYELDLDNKWIEYDRSEWESANGPADLSMGQMADTGMAIEGFINSYNKMPIQEAGTVEINGITAEKYVMSLDSEAMKSYLPEEQRAELEGALGDVYQGTEKYDITFYVADGHIIKESVNFSGIASDSETGTKLQMTMVIDVAYSNIGVNTPIELPNAADIKQPELNQ